MFYQLKNKDEIILRFEIGDIQTQALGKDIAEQAVLNIDIRNDNLPRAINKDDLKKSLKSWIENRKIPKNRQFVKNIISSYAQQGKSDFMAYVNVSLALSLNDTFWITPAGADYKWSDYNLYDNRFDEALSLVAFSGMNHKVSGFTSSPEYTTNGMLKKCWYREWNGIYLYKGSSEAYANGGREAYAEFYMAQVAKVLGFEHIKYDLRKFHDELVSSCKIFTSQKEGYVPIYYFLSERDKRARGNELVNAVAKIYGKEKLEDLLLFDAIIYNTDRHLGNFGMMIDNDTGAPLRSAPIFDNGLSIINLLIKSELSDINAALAETTSFFGYIFDAQLKLAVSDRHLEGLEKLSKFEFEKHAEFNLDDEWLEPIQNHIRDRAVLAMKFCDENKDEQKSEQSEQILNRRAARHK